MERELLLGMAQLRANVFLALEEQESQESPHPFVSDKLKEFQKTREGKLSLALVREFLEFFQLDFTTAVFDPETNAPDTYPGREQLAKDLGLDQDSSPEAPLLSSLLKRPAHPTSPLGHTHFPGGFSLSSHSPLLSSHPSLFTTHPSAHSPLHPPPSHPSHLGPFTTYPTSLPHHHTHSSPHTTTTTERTPPPPSTSSPTTKSLPTLPSSEPANLPRVPHSSSTPPGDASAPASSAGQSEQAASSLLQGLERDLLAKPEKRDHQLDDPHKSSSAATQRAPGRAGSDTAALSGADQRVGVDQVVGLPSAKTSRDGLDDFYNAGPPPPLPLSSVGQRKANGRSREGEGDSDSSVSEHLEEEEESLASGKTTDVTQTENSLRGDYDFETLVLPKEQ